MIGRPSNSFETTWISKWSLVPVMSAALTSAPGIAAKIIRSISPGVIGSNSRAQCLLLFKDLFRETVAYFVEKFSLALKLGLPLRAVNA